MLQGFDEFMNLVIDDAVEVKQATKTDEEKRRDLGRPSIRLDIHNLAVLMRT
jgi:small nuclear ribonucleoprotein E